MSDIYQIGHELGELSRRVEDLAEQQSSLRRDLDEVKTWLQRGLLLALLSAYPILGALQGDAIAKAIAGGLKAALRLP